MTVLVAGASGLVGRAAVERLLEREATQVFAVVRRTLPRTHPRLRTMVTRFENLASQAPIGGRAALCALGTTLKSAGSEGAFRAVDHDAVLAFARWARAGGVQTFALVSSVGADPASRNFYLRVKGETEAAIAALGFARFVALRPGLLLGAREESRPAEAIARRLMPAVNHLLLGPARKYRGITAALVADALVRAGLDDRPGRFVWHHDELKG